MPAYSKAKIKRLLKKSDTAPTDDAKGDAFEELFCYLFGKIPGITHIERNELSIFSSEEIDAAAWNEQDPRGLKSLNTPIPMVPSGPAKASTPAFRERSPVPAREAHSMQM